MCLPVGEDTRASGTEAALKGTHRLPPPRQPPAWGHPCPPTLRRRTLRKPAATQSRGAWSWGLDDPAECLQKVAPWGRPKPATGPRGHFLSCFRASSFKSSGAPRGVAAVGPHGGWVGGGGGGGKSPAGAGAAQGVSAWRGCLLTNARRQIRVEGVLLVAAARGPVSVSSQLCWQPPFP